MAAAAVSALALASCSPMTEDLEPCPDGLYVRFAYDYNTQRADMFPYHVGHVRLNVFDETGRKVAERVVSNSADDSPLAEHGYAVYFPTTELAPGHSYRLQAVALQKDWQEALGTPGAKYRLTSAETAEGHHVRLDHGAPDTPWDCGHHHVAASAPLDTLWHTLKVTSTGPLDRQDDPGVHRTQKPYTLYPHEDQLVRVEKDRFTYATVSLMRDTKHLNLTVRQIDNPADCFADYYDVYIVDDNTHLDGNNEIVPEQTVHYTPHASWTSRFSEGGVEMEETGPSGRGASRADDGVLQRTAHYDLMFNRIMYPEKAEDGARLYIRNRKDGSLVADINLAHVLSDGRMAYELQNYGTQEYLDREHDYRLDFILKGGEWQYIEIHILSWVKRIQRVELAAEPQGRGAAG